MLGLLLTERGVRRASAAASGAAVSCYGPITQSALLQGLGIEARLHQLLDSATEEQAEALVMGCR